MAVARKTLMLLFIMLPIFFSNSFFTIPVKKEGESLFGNDVPQDYSARLNLSDCPTRFHKKFLGYTEKMLFGYRALESEFPHMAVIGWLNDGVISWKCGGSLITKRFVLTAAHCGEISKRNEVPNVVRLGDVNLASVEGDNYAQQFSIKQFVRHPQHRFRAKYFDIALIELDHEVNLTLHVCPACVWYDSKTPFENYDVAGFGATDGYVVNGSPQLLKAHLTKVSRFKCNQDFKAVRGLPYGLAEDHLCASDIKMDTCNGDSGGPLQISLRTYDQIIPTLVGVISFGQICGHGSYGVYQTVQPYKPWIESIVGESLDLFECAKKYHHFRKPYIDPYEPHSEVSNPYVSRVDLHWKQTEQEHQCAGTLIDYNIVITSASCTLNTEGKEPNYITVLEEDVPITEIARHPKYKSGSLKNNVALIRLKYYLLENEYVAPACLYPNSDHGSFLSLRKPNSSIYTFIPSGKQCNDSILFGLNFTEDLDGNHVCFSKRPRFIPGLCDIDEGGPYLSWAHSTLHGINMLSGGCESQSALIFLTLGNYVAWIESFVLNRSTAQKQRLVAQEMKEEDLLFKLCNTREVADGICVDRWACDSEIYKQQVNTIDMTMCGFSYVCCPWSIFEASELKPHLLKKNQATNQGMSLGYPKN